MKNLSIVASKITFETDKIGIRMFYVHKNNWEFINKYLFLSKYFEDKLN